jgi:hypothetical protein
LVERGLGVMVGGSMLGCRGWVGALMVLLGSHVGLVKWIVETLRWVGGKFVDQFSARFISGCWKAPSHQGFGSISSS